MEERKTNGNGKNERKAKEKRRAKKNEINFFCAPTTSSVSSHWNHPGSQLLDPGSEPETEPETRAQLQCSFPAVKLRVLPELPRPILRFLPDLLCPSCSVPPRTPLWFGSCFSPYTSFHLHRKLENKFGYLKHIIYIALNLKLILYI